MVEFLSACLAIALKLYAHSGDKTAVMQIVECLRRGLKEPNGKFKPDDLRESKTLFIYKESLLNNIAQSDFTVEKIVDHILNFHSRMSIALAL